MAKRKTITNEMFGVLTHTAGDLWKGFNKLRIFGKIWTVELMVDIDPKDGIESNQIAAYNTFRENTEAVVLASENAVFHYYKSIYDEYRNRYGITDPNDERIPVIRAKEEVYPLVKPEGVSFPYARQQPTFGILCQCTWEEERGLAVKFESGKIVGVGFQDVVL